MNQKIYGFKEGDPRRKDLLGGKGSGLAEMVRLGLRVPDGFTIIAPASVHFLEQGHQWPDGLEIEVIERMKVLEDSMGKTFGDPHNPLLISVRSGARASMPGMMDTILNLGLNDRTVKGLSKTTNNERFALDSYRRFIMMYSTVVFGISKELFEHALTVQKEKESVTHDHELSVAGLRNLINAYKIIVRKADHVFPQDVYEQLFGAITAVFLSWNNDRAIFYREQNGIPDNWGTAVNVQSMVFGNKGNTSGTGVAFSRDMSTGENKISAEWMQNAQGEDVVSGIRTPQPLLANATSQGLSLEEVMPEVFKELIDTIDKLERVKKDVVDIEFTLEEGVLYMLQVRIAKRSGAAAVRIAVEMAQEGLITEDEAIVRITPDHLEQMLHPELIIGDTPVIAKGLNASPGGAVGQIVFTATEAVAQKALGNKVVLVRPQTSPEDIRGMDASTGILTACGGMTSHAAVVGRGMGKPCVVGCSALSINMETEELVINGSIFKKGDWISFNGSTGNVYAGKLATKEPVMTEYFETLLEWSDEHSEMKVRANAETVKDAINALRYGALGIGLCRGEHMFFEEDRLPIVQNLILNILDQEQRTHYLSLLEPILQSDFEKIFEIFKNKPVTIRLLDPPLHEFLPDDKTLELRGYDDETLAMWKQKRDALHEVNPMLGLRGSRLGIIFPDLYEMQVRAIFEAACAVGHTAHPEIMIPLIGAVREFTILKDMVDRIGTEVMLKNAVRVKYLVGAMIEIPRAAVIADKIAEHADFFSFGTNDLTQMTLGISRDDAIFIPEYVEKGIYVKDPFVSIDEEGVGKLMKDATFSGRETKHNLKVGICGEHGGDPESIAFCSTLRLDYVSCSPLRVPIARLACAQASIATMVAEPVL